MLPVPVSNSLDLDALPADVRKVVHIVACLLERYGAPGDVATTAALGHVCWSARVAGVWPAIVDESHGIRV